MVSCRSIVSVICAAALFTSVSARKNLYMVSETEEYNKVTAKLIGTYDIESYTRKDEGEQMGKTYVSGSLEIKPQEKSGRSGEAVFTFVVSPEVTKGRIEAWNKRKKELVVTEYKIVTTARWTVSKSGDILHLNEPEATAVITGEGKQAKNFQGFEQGIIESASEMSNSGGLNGMIGGMVMGKSTGTDKFVPKIPDQTNFEITDEGMTFKNMFDLGFKLKK